MRKCALRLPACSLNCPNSELTLGELFIRQLFLVAKVSAPGCLNEDTSVRIQTIVILTQRRIPRVLPLQIVSNIEFYNLVT
jgi:hypothetical protein